MSELRITAIRALQILDSRGYPTLRVQLEIDTGAVFEASAPSGASTGAHEAVELRDGGTPFSGRGVTGALASVTGEISNLLTSRPWVSQRELDEALCALDGTGNKSRLGANALVAVSMAAARGFAAGTGHSLHTWISQALGRAERLPVPHFNVLNGGQHAANALAFQEFMIAPVGAATYPQALEWGADIYHALAATLRTRGLATGLGDEGGYAPEISSPEEALDLIVSGIDAAGHRPGISEVAIALDPAANSFFQDGSYHLNGRHYTPSQMVSYYGKLLDNYPIRSLEDPLAEDDAESWPELVSALGGRAQIVGDDLFVTQAARVTAGIRSGSATAVLIKPNQVGTVTETLETLAVASAGGFTAMVSHRSGETTDTFVADLTVGSGCGQLKAGAPARGERVAKYNRLLEIADSNPALPYGLAILSGEGDTDA
ncbi:phosphopyruvate hydratase [Arthrobacter livingstonensis]|uniref:Enolase n=1 Tax=Arthrobacter livingstonensis TaxID=670078 RepID=A0A2V5L1J2_9MICC|nr:phosphopyruvate hydratase [Arthrobacter livingstonensis]PYI65069.1 phosphopyruvate hydratase [Arthrobacter livingstonensis]